MKIVTILTLLVLSIEAHPQEIAEPSASAVPTGHSLTPEQQQWLVGASRHDRDGWIHVKLNGPPRILGFQHGYLLAKEISQSLQTTRKDWEYHSGMDWSWMVENGSELLLPGIDTSILSELDGLVDGLSAAGIRTSREEMIVYNGIIELQKYWWPTVKDSMKILSPGQPQHSCSSFIATGSMTRDGGIVLGHNTMTSYVGADCNIILDILPASGHRILMQGSPGWVHSGTDFFITDAGLIGSETTIDGFSGFDMSGIPEFVRMRRATQDASSIDEWCAIMRNGNNGGYANAWLIGDVKTNEIARLELGLKYVAFERTKDGYYIGSNVAEDVKILRHETSLNETDIRNSDIARRVRWKQLMKEYKGRITAQVARSFEADHFDTYLKEERLGSRSLCAHWEYDSTDPAEVPFDPSGTVDAKVVDSQMAKRMVIAVRWGSGCGTPFDATKFLEQHPQFEWMSGYLKGRASYPWTEFRSGE